MNLHEEFSRCHCGHAYLRREVLILAKYQKNDLGIVTELKELPEHKEIHYVCCKCNTLIYKKRE